MKRLESSVVPETNLNQIKKIYVARFEPDRRYLNRIIADQLALMGYDAIAGEENNIPKDIDTMVTYIDNWQWDITNYMIKISIQFRNAQNGKLLASGESYRTSLIRKQPPDMIRETLEEIFKRK